MRLTLLALRTTSRNLGIALELLLLEVVFFSVLHTF